MMRIGLYKGYSWPSKAIKWHSRSLYSHAALLPTPTTAIEAWADSMIGGKVYAGNINALHKADTPIDIYSVNADVRWGEVEEFANAQVGKDYDWRMVYGFVSRKPREAKKSQDKWFCSELVFAALQYGGCRLLRNIEAYQVAPGTLALSPLLHYIETIKTTGADF